MYDVSYYKVLHLPLHGPLPQHPASESPELTNVAKSIPLAGVYIADLPQVRAGWCIALQQWYDVDPKTGRSLKDWPDEWFKDSMKSKTAVKRSQRALIAHELEQ
jgi:hypothetical protein